MPRKLGADTKAYNLGRLEGAIEVLDDLGITWESHSAQMLKWAIEDMEMRAKSGLGMLRRGTAAFYLTDRHFIALVCEEDFYSLDVRRLVILNHVFIRFGELKCLVEIAFGEDGVFAHEVVGRMNFDRTGRYADGFIGIGIALIVVTGFLQQRDVVLSGQYDDPAVMGGGGGNRIRSFGIVGYRAAAFGNTVHSDRTVAVEGCAFVPEAVALDFDMCAAEGMSDVGDFWDGNSRIVSMYIIS